MSKLKNPKGAGRKRKYDNPAEQTRLKKLVYLYRERNPSGIIKISHLVRFSEEMNKIKPDEFPSTYNKDVWSNWGREIINLANEPITIKIVSKLGDHHEIPNFSDIVDKYMHDKPKLLEHLLTCENLLHESLTKNNDFKLQNNILEKQINSLKLEISELEGTIKKYEKMTLEMAHHSGVEKYRVKYGLKNQISVSKNQKAFDNLDDLHSFLDPDLTLKNNEEKNSLKKIVKEESPILANWKKLRN
ncbi:MULTISPECIES: hypothetical protein [Bacillus]|uniref:hypothetical protein n=1 Tax=Bacillus TaxID=1386 RepID=UPI001C0116A2|nr:MULTISPECIES: hypothetical protein [Bacillus]MBY7104024.1 hypothetical protein [Bacillus sp. 6YEL31]QWG93307.1 hypothetical protein EXW33_00470 [Bacillus toyonensis]QWG98352.1 hypothetical protein EXW33_28090 [Bacillus toyonensis]